MNTMSKHTLTNLALKAHFESHMQSDLQRNIDARRFKSTMGFADWISEVTELDEELAEDQAQTQVMIDASNAKRATRHKPLVERISKSPSHTNSISPGTSGMTNPHLKLSKLTDKEKRLLVEHQGCMHCHTFYCNHPRTPDACLMKASNSWPNPNTTKTLTLAMALASKLKAIMGLSYIEPTSNKE
ncbi:hypothetical protein C0989_005773, partial [Termitomyces sp. Mn162]